jgi:hypothetical protein
VCVGGRGGGGGGAYISQCSVGNLIPAMGARNQVGIGLSYRHASLCSLATQFQTRFLESNPGPIAGLKFSTQKSLSRNVCVVFLCYGTCPFTLIRIQDIAVLRVEQTEQEILLDQAYTVSPPLGIPECFLQELHVSLY